MRLFVALRPPPEVRGPLVAAMAGIEGARWQTDAQLHLTLAFLGETDRHGADAALQALAGVGTAPFPVELGSFGSFDAGRPDRVSTLWIAVQPAGAVGGLAATVRGALRRVGLAPDTRRFVPHITLARFAPRGAPRAALAPYLSAIAPPRAGWIVEDFHLVESLMGAGGSHYVPVAGFALTGLTADRHRS